jgi:hypothetical protein
VGQVEDEIRIDAEDALAAIEGLEVRRVFSGWGFYRHGLLFAAAWEGEFRFRTRQGRHWIYEIVDRGMLATLTSWSSRHARSWRDLRKNLRPGNPDPERRIAAGRKRPVGSGPTKPPGPHARACLTE